MDNDAIVSGMSKRNDAFILPVNAARALEICKQVIGISRWTIEATTAASWTIRETSDTAPPFSLRKVSLVIECVPAKEGTQVDIHGKNFGIDYTRLNEQMRKFRDLIELAARTS